MLMTVTPLPTPNDAGPLHLQAPPPLLPKPGKENIRLQKVLKKAAKKKNPPAAAAVQPKAFRSTLSPVSEASPDLEHWERSPLPATPRTPDMPALLSLSLPPRFFIKPVVHHVASPYPQHRPFTFTVSELRSLSECLRRTPSPRPPSPSVRPVNPPLQLQQPPKTRQAAPSPGPVFAGPAHLPRPIPEIAEPAATNIVTPSPRTPVFEAAVQEVLMNEVQAPLMDVVSLRVRTPTLEGVQKMTARREDGNAAVVCPPEASQASVPTVTLPPTTTNHALSKTTREAPPNSAPKIEPSKESAQRPRTPSAQLSTPTPLEDIAIVPPVSNTRPLTPRQQVTVAAQQNKVPVVQVTMTPPNSIITLHPIGKTEQGPVPPDVSMGNEPGGGGVPKAEALLKHVEKVKPPRTKLSGWSRLKKHLVVEPEEPQFPVPESEVSPVKEVDEEKRGGKDGEDISLDKKVSKPKESRANKMWDALLYQMSPKEGDTKEKEKTSESIEKAPKKEEKPSFFFRCRLPLQLYRPRFDARKLREAASRPLKKITTMFDLGRLHRKPPEEEPKDFNRTASGWQLK